MRVTGATALGSSEGRPPFFQKAGLAESGEAVAEEVFGGKVCGLGLGVFDPVPFVFVFGRTTGFVVDAEFAGS